MNDSNVNGPQANDGAEQGTTGEKAGMIVRRAVLKHGVKVAYVAPVVLSAMFAKSAHASVPSGHGSLPKIWKRRLAEVPADVLELIALIEREFVAA